MHRAHLCSDLNLLFRRKRDAISGIEAVDVFVGAAVAEACAPDSGISLFGHLTTAGRLLPRDLAELIPDAELSGRSRFQIPEGRMKPFVRTQLFVSLMAELEDMFAELVRLTLSAFPRKAAQKQLSVIDVIEAHQVGETLSKVIESEQSALFYGGSQKLRERLEDLISGPNVLGPEWPAYVEMRARRDIGLHAGWKMNRVYLDKAGAMAAPEDAKWLYPDETYFRNACAVARRLFDILDTHCAAKFSRCIPRHVFRDMWSECPLASVMPFDEAGIDGAPPRPSGKSQEWGWSGSEQLLYDFFMHIYNRRNVDLAALFGRWPGAGSQVVRSWLERPFHF